MDEAIAMAAEKVNNDDCEEHKDTEKKEQQEAGDERERLRVKIQMEDAVDTEAEKIHNDFCEKHKDVRENLEFAMKCNPEILLTNVTLPFICCKINGQTIRALVDSGADGCVMSQVLCGCK